MLARELQTAAGASETLLDYKSLLSHMRKRAHVQRPVLQTAAGASESLLNDSVLRSCVHLTSVRETEDMYASAPVRSHRRLSAAHGAAQAPGRAGLAVCSARAADSRRCERNDL